jgi:large subunit ribosomal protein L24
MANGKISMKLKKGDEVQVTLGKDKGKKGKIQRVFTKEAKVLIEGVNQFKRHLKARSQNEPADIVTITKPLPVAGVALICPKCKKPTRVGYEIQKETKNRVCRNCGKVI